MQSRLDQSNMSAPMEQTGERKQAQECNFTMSIDKTKIMSVDLAKIKESLQQLIEFLSNNQMVLSKNLVVFLTENLWQHIPHSIQFELLNLSNDALCNLPASDVGFEILHNDTANNLMKFRGDVMSRRLENMEVLTSQEEMAKCTDLLVANAKEELSSEQEKLTTQQTVRPKMNTFMSPKKHHEVNILADVIAELARKANIKQIVDIGSGKGYLGQQLASSHSLNVLGIDSSQTNSYGAQVRGQLMKGRQPYTDIVKSKKKEESRTDIKITNNVHSDLSECSCGANDSRTSNDGMLDGRTTCAQSKRDIINEEHDTSNSHLEDSILDLSLLDETSKDSSMLEELSTTATIVNQDGSEEDISVKSKQPNSGDSVGAQAIRNIDNANLKPIFKKRKKKKHLPDQTATDLLYQPVTAFVDTRTDFNEFLKEKNAEKVVLTGLHTCGDLCSSILRIFVANPSARILCNVPCCHNLITEEFDNAMDEAEAKDDGMSRAMHYGFPMSEYLRSQQTKMGSVSKYVACMAVDKLADGKHLPTEKLFYRMVLQVILQENYTIPSREQKTGKLAAKCTNFVEYTRRALKKMGYEENKLSDAVIQQYYDIYQPDMKKLEGYHQYRGMFAPSIEALILLDKLCYLKEQDIVKEAYLVRLFDPILSPRCHALIATK